MRPGDDPASAERSHPTMAAAGDDIPVATRLLVFTDGGAETHVLPDEGTVTLGRSKECEIRIDHPSISRKHAVLHLGGSLTLEDLGSFNGTKIGGRKLGASQREALAAGAIVELGTVMVVVRPGTRVARTQPARALGAMDPVQRLVEVVAQSSMSVILLGETGVGKTVVASSLHRGSPRAQAAFIQLNCAALPEALLEGELLGYERGAFTGAAAAKAGLLEAAHQGTLFLDEIGELPLSTQAKLLHVVESGEVMRIGSLKPRPIDVRFVAATNRDLEAMVAAGAFRKDLYFRLNGISIAIPPLRDRVAEIAALAASFLTQAAKKNGREPPALSPAALRSLEGYSWPGNLRELKNVLERAALLCQRPVLEPEDLPLASGLGTVETPPEAAATAPASGALRTDLEALERQRIVEALERSRGNQTLAAQALGISRRTLINRLEAYDLPRPRRDAKQPK